MKESVNGAKKQSVLKSIMSGRSSNLISLLIAYVGIFIIFSLASPYFLSVRNLMNMLNSATITGIMGAGTTVIMLLGHIDMSQYSICALSGITIAMMLRAGQAPWLIILCCIAVGLVCGLLNGVLISVFKISGIIATMGTMQIFRGIANLVTNAQTMMVNDPTFSFIGKTRILGVFPVSVIIMIIILLAIYYLLNHTLFGRKIYAAGGNQQASYLAGINIKMLGLLAMTISGLTAAIGGIVLTSQVSAIVASAGEGNEMAILSAVILGGISLSGGKGTVIGTVIGIVILATIQNGMTLLSISSFYQMIINGLVLIAAILIDVLRSGALKKQ